MSHSSHHFRLLLWTVGLVGLAACSRVSTDLLPQDGQESDEVAGVTKPTPIYVSVAGHIEDDLRLTDCGHYVKERQNILDFAEDIREFNVDFNLQASYEWYTGVQKCESEQLMAEIGGMNVMDYLVSEYGFEIDVHQEGASEDDVNSGNNWADIRYLGGQVTDDISDTVGFQWNNQEQYERLQGGEPGLLHTDFTWYPELLVGGVSVDHTNGDFSNDMTAMGMWIPSGFNEEEFFVHDESEDARMVYVGSGPNQFMDDWGAKGNCHFTSSVDFIKTMVRYIETGEWNSGEIYTYSLLVPQRVMTNAEDRQMLLAHLRKLQVLEEQGKIVLAHPTEIRDIWETEYDSEPNIVRYEEVSPEDYTCRKLR